MVGDHDGTIDFTIGQRRGLGVAAADGPRYVTGIDPDTRHGADRAAPDLEIVGCDLAATGFVAGVPPDVGATTSGSRSATGRSPSRAHVAAHDGRTGESSSPSPSSASPPASRPSSTGATR